MTVKDLPDGKACVYRDKVCLSGALVVLFVLSFLAVGVLYLGFVVYSAYQEVFNPQWEETLFYITSWVFLSGMGLWLVIYIILSVYCIIVKERLDTVWDRKTSVMILRALVLVIVVGWGVILLSNLDMVRGIWWGLVSLGYDEVAKVIAMFLLAILLCVGLGVGVNWVLHRVFQIYQRICERRCKAGDSLINILWLRRK